MKIDELSKFELFLRVIIFITFGVLLFAAKANHVPEMGVVSYLLFELVEFSIESEILDSVDVLFFFDF